MTDRSGPDPVDWPRTVRNITVGALIGAVLGLVVGLILVATDVVENPFWSVSAGLMAGAVLSSTALTGRGSGGKPPT